MSADLLIIVPTRGRPASLQRVVAAWDATGAFEVAHLLFAVDADDPALAEYGRAFDGAPTDRIGMLVDEKWRPMVHKLDAAARSTADQYRAVGFAGDDHIPRTHGWAKRYLSALDELGVGIVYGADGMRAGQRWPLPTQWAMSSQIVGALGRMVPAPVDHLYCDNAIRDLGQAADCLQHLPDVMIEHMHPAAGKAEMDDGYRRVNSNLQYVDDRARYRRWRDHQLTRDAEMIRALRA